MNEAIIKEKKGINIFVLALIILLAAALGFGGFSWFRATRNALPEIPAKVTSEEDLYNNITKGIIVTGSTTFSTEDLNGALELARKAANKALSDGKVDFTIDNLYGELKDSQLICYMLATSKGHSYNFTVNAEVDYTAPEAKIYVSEIKLGKLKLPANWIMKKVAKYPMPANISVEGRRFVYNTSSLNDLLIETARKNQTISKVEDTVGSILSIFGVDFGLEDVIDFKINDIYIRDGQLTIKSDLFKK